MPDFADPYLDPETGILKNLAGANTLEDLREAEANITAVSELSLEDIPRTNDVAEIQNIHKRLFGRIYEWAGEFRTVDIKKGSEEFFLSHTQFSIAFNYLFEELSKVNFLKNLDKKEFIDVLTFFYEQLNFIHPFREGNGRTQRIFWQRIAKDAGYEIKWELVVGDELDIASQIGREQRNLNPLLTLFSRIVIKA